MYIILFYDIADKSLRAKKDNSYKIRKEVEKYLTRVQFSVFEGEISPGSGDANAILCPLNNPLYSCLI
ncbi:MAG: CRISPR-associated endonuclease Cas2 [Campylobacterota bacterium]|nr:CRISPR-associated endonuclease Cas2 [Campylobacterota bacterium]